MEKKIIFCILTVALLVSCAKTTSPIPNQQLATETLVPKPAATIALTNTPNILMTSTATATPASMVIKNCLSISDKETPMQDIATGTIVYFPANEKNALAQDIQTGKMYKLPAEKFDFPYGFLSVSPDGNKLAYIETTYEKDSNHVTKTILWVVNAHGDVLRKITFGYGLWHTRWLDNEHLLFDISETFKEGKVLIVNPFNQEQHYIGNKLPELYTGELYGWTTWLVQYSPNLEWVVYYNDHVETVVYDVVYKKNIWESPRDTYGDHAWSPDGNEVAIATYRENGNLSIISRNGAIKPILKNDAKNIPSSPSWSPNGRYLAFLNNHTILLYDKQTDRVTDYCIRGEWNPNRPPLWSSNNLQFIATGVGNPNQSYIGSVLIDIQNNKAYTISKNDEYYPMAWMNSLP